MSKKRRYFRTGNATRLYRVGDDSFKFELAFLAGGSWVGIYATDSEGEADALNSIGNAVVEIDEATYELLKKKGQSSTVAQPVKEQAKDEKEEKPAVVKLEDEIELGKATYKDPLEEKS